MPRKGPAPIRSIAPDARFNSVLVAQLINRVLSRGKKALAERIVYQALDLAAQRLKESQVDILERAVANVRPELEVRSRRVGGATYQVPMEVRPRRATTLAIRWIVLSAKARREKTMALRLAGEIQDAFNATGVSIKRRDDMHRMAEANKAFSHYRW
jgi:small subunit ribosomal protein S7